MTQNPSIDLGHLPLAPPQPQPPQYERAAIILFWLASAALLLFSIFHFASASHTGASLGQSSGIVIGQAIDLADGVFYRPIISDRGFGGTRYMPLPFLLIAPFIRLGFDPVNTAFAITLLTDIALLAGTYLLMRRLAVQPSLAAPAAVLVLAAACGQAAATTVRGDLLPATLNVWGLAMICSASPTSPRPRPFLAALFFTLAFTAKITALHGLAAASLALLLSKHWRTALKLAAATLLGIALALAVIHLASHGQFLENMRACATGGTDWSWVRRNWHSRLMNSGFRSDWVATLFFCLAFLAIFRVRWEKPAHLLTSAAIVLAAVGLDWYLSQHMIRPVAFLLAGAFLILAMFLAFRIHWTDLRQPPLWAMLITAIVTMGLFTSPGIAFNNFIDWHILAVVFIVLQLARRRLPVTFTTALLAMIAVASIPHLALAHRDKGLSRQRAAGILAAMGPGSGPFLCKPPMLHVYAGHAPYVLDPWMFRHMPQRPRLETLLYDKLRARYFRAVIVGDLDSAAGESGAANQFGPDFADILQTHYAETARYKEARRLVCVVYKPRPAN